MASPDPVGYHFTAGFTLHWEVLSPHVIERGRSLGYVISDDGNEVAPGPMTLTFSGTRWLRHTSGGLRFDVLRYDPSLRASLVKVAGAVGANGIYGFDLADASRIGDEDDAVRSEVAIGLWLRRGALVLLEADGPPALPEEVLAAFDVWEGLDDLFRVSLNEKTALVMVAEEELSRIYEAPSWAPEFGTIRLRVFTEETRAILRHEAMTVTMSMHPIAVSRSER